MKVFKDRKYLLGVITTALLIMATITSPITDLSLNKGEKLSKIIRTTWEHNGIEFDGNIIVNNHLSKESHIQVDFQGCKRLGQKEIEFYTTPIMGRSSPFLSYYETEDEKYMDSKMLNIDKIEIGKLFEENVIKDVFKQCTEKTWEEKISVKSKQKIVMNKGTIHEIKIVGDWYEIQLDSRDLLQLKELNENKWLDQIANIHIMIWVDRQYRVRVAKIILTMNEQNVELNLELSYQLPFDFQAFCLKD